VFKGDDLGLGGIPSLLSSASVVQRDFTLYCLVMVQAEFVFCWGNMKMYLNIIFGCI
jgi:hypothetical protein